MTYKTFVGNELKEIEDQKLPNNSSTIEFLPFPQAIVTLEGEKPDKVSWSLVDEVGYIMFDKRKAKVKIIDSQTISLTIEEDSYDKSEKSVEIIYLNKVI